MLDLTELNKLEDYLRENGYNYERIEDEENLFGDQKIIYKSERHQLVVLDDECKYEWDAVCNTHSYGSDEGLLEIMGIVVNPEYDCVEGWMTADQIIARLEAMKCDS